MNPKWSLPASLVCGLIGGILGNYLMQEDMTRKSATFETVRVTKELVVAGEGSPEKGCRVSSDGAVTATGGLIANQVRGNLIVGRSLLATLNSTQQALEQQQIAAEITANPDRGGELIIRNREGVFCPLQGPSKQGFETFIGFDKNSHIPTIFTQHIGQGPQGRAYVVCMTPKADKPATPNASAAPTAPVAETANHANQASGQPSLR
jgi:hypothetical protein